MNQDTARLLLELNKRFYQTFAAAFSSTRGRAQPGVQRFVQTLKADESVLDLGCGNGTLAVEMASTGKRGPYLGTDSCASLLEVARGRTYGDLRADFLETDLSENWSATLRERRFDSVTAFAVLHHIPGTELRIRLLRQARELLVPGGRLAHSEWQFQRSPRLRERVQAWEAAGFREADLDPGDHLLDWRAGGQGLRYVHVFTPAELDALAAEAGFRILESYRSDGQGQELSLYQIWQAA